MELIQGAAQPAPDCTTSIDQAITLVLRRVAWYYSHTIIVLFASPTVLLRRPEVMYKSLALASVRTTAPWFVT